MNDKVAIVSFMEKYSEAFKELNLLWISEYFDVEDEDIRSLNHPKDYFLDKGGEIFFAKFNDKIIGTVAIAHSSEEIYELAKMTVHKNYQKQGIGRLLVQKSINFVKQKKGKKLFLITNDILQPALNLYYSCGFVLDDMNDDNRYDRGNTKMYLNIEDK